MTGYDILMGAAIWLFASIPASILMGGVIGFTAEPEAVPVRCAPGARSSVRMVDMSAQVDCGAE
jgi:hypothetical protein